MINIFQLVLQTTYQKCNNGSDHEFYLNNYDDNQQKCIDQCQLDDLTKYVWFSLHLEDKYYKICSYGQQYCKQSDNEDIIRVSSSSYQCVNSCENNEQSYVWYYSSSLQDYVCSDQQQCSEALTGGFKKVTEINQCVQACIGVNYDFISLNDDNKCVESCDGNVYVQQNTEYKCTQYQSCKQHPRFQRRSIQGYCEFSCSYNGQITVWYYNETLSDNICILGSCGTPNTPIEFLTKTTFEYFQCVKNCIDSENQKYGFKYGDQYSCIDYCPDNQVWFFDETELDNVCSGKQACGGDELPLSQYPIELTNRQCISKCSQSVTYSFLSADQSSCVTSCGDQIVWTQQETEKVCSESTSCAEISNFNFQIENSLECVENCSETDEFHFIKFGSEKVCVSDCDGKVWIQIGENQEKKCLSDEKCNQNEDLINQNLIKQTPENQCVQKCSESDEFKFYSSETNQCVESCRDENWYKNDNLEQICIQKCEQNNFDSINLFDKQCNKEEECKQYYHFIEKNQNIKCYYYSNITSCQQLENIENNSVNNMIFTYNNTKECTDCPNELNRFQSDNNQLVCLYDTIVSNKSDGLPLTQIIIIIVLCLIIVILTISLAVSLSKLNKVQKQLSPLLNMQKSKSQIMKSNSLENIETVQQQSVLQPVKYQGKEDNEVQDN